MQQSFQKPPPSKQQQLQPGKRAEAKSKALARGIPSILQPLALSSSLRTAATLGMPAAVLDQRTALLAGQVLHFCSHSKESTDNGVSVSKRRDPSVKAAAVGRKDGRYGMGCRLSLLPWRQKGGAGVSEGCAHLEETHPNLQTQVTQWREERCTSLEGPRETWEQDPSSQPALNAGCISKAAFKKGQGGWRGAAPIHGGYGHKSRASLCGCERKSQASTGWRWSQASVWKPFVTAGLSEPCREGRGGRGRPVLAACTAENLSQRKPAVSSVCPLPIYCPALQAGREHPVGSRSLHCWVLAGLSFPTQVLPPLTGEASVPIACRSHGEGTGQSPALLSACIPSGRGKNLHGVCGWKPALRCGRQCCSEHSPLLSPDMGFYTISCLPAGSPSQGSSSPLRKHQPCTLPPPLLLPSLPNTPVRSSH